MSSKYPTGTSDGVNNSVATRTTNMPRTAGRQQAASTIGPLPQHVAVIMDGNGRWAKKRNLPRIEGHSQGVTSVRKVTEHAARKGIEQLTLYCLSSENWQRPQAELDFLMLLLEQYMVEERSLLMRERIRLVVIGNRDGLPSSTLAAIDETVGMCCENDGMRLCLAVNYGGRAEIVKAAKTLAHQVASGQLHPDDIDESSIESQLETNGMPDPDLLIRTAGEMRISNFLLWQMSYAEFWVTPDLWPDFTERHLDQAITAFQSRERRFGGLASS
jgi:undecaprenyl diphosphate synthase